MKILLFGISNVGKTTIGKKLSEKLKYRFDDLDEEIKRQYNTIDSFQLEYPFNYERHRKRADILAEIINKYEDNVVIAVSPINYSEFLTNILDDNNIIAVNIYDKPENILKRLVYADENDKIYPIKIQNKKEEKHYLKDLKEDIKYYNKVYANIKNEFNIDGKSQEEAAKDLQEILKNIITQ